MHEGQGCDSSGKHCKSWIFHGPIIIKYELKVLRVILLHDGRNEEGLVPQLRHDDDAEGRKEAVDEDIVSNTGSLLGELLCCRLTHY